MPGSTAKTGCSTNTLSEWVKTADLDSGKRADVPEDMTEKMKSFERENRALRQARVFNGCGQEDGGGALGHVMHGSVVSYMADIEGRAGSGQGQGRWGRRVNERAMS